MSKPPSKPGRARMLRRLIIDQGGKCSICGKPLVFEQANFDHHVPRSRGGRGINNYRAAHIQCNLDKGDKMPTGESLGTVLTERLARRQMHETDREVKRTKQERRDLCLSLLRNRPDGISAVDASKLLAAPLAQTWKALSTLRSERLARVEYNPAFPLNDTEWSWFAVGDVKPSVAQAAPEEEFHENEFDLAICSLLEEFA